MSKLRGDQWLHPIDELIRARAKVAYDTPQACAYVIDLDFDMASKFMERRPESQRNIIDAQVKRYARALRGGRWMTSVSSPMVFDSRLRLVDGQHRCSAVLESQIPIHDVEVRILKHEAETGTIPVDMHRARSQSDHEKWLGRQICRPVSAGIIYESCDFLGWKQKEMPVDERAHIVLTHPHLEDLLSIDRIKHASGGLVGGILRCVKANRDATRFFSAVLRNEHRIDGEFSQNIKLLATWIREPGTKRTGEQYRRESAYRAIKAWNDHRAGREPQIMPKYSVEWAIPEASS